MALSEARRLRISRFDQDGGTFDEIIEKIRMAFKISVDTLKIRQRGGIGSEARKAFAFVAAKEYNAPASKIAEYLGVGNAAVSAMAHAGRGIVEERKITI